MFDIRSRYHGVPLRTFVAPDGSSHVHIARRLLPDLDTLGKLSRVDARPDERLDVLAMRVLRDPLLAWRICDVNRAPDPMTLLELQHQRVAVPGAGR